MIKSKNIKTVLISTAPLPYKGVGSWTTEMNYLLERENSIDYIIGPKSQISIAKPTQVFVEELSLSDKVLKKINPLKRFNHYVKALRKILEKEQNIILQLKDNVGLLKAIVAFIDENNLRKRVYLQYHHHTFFPFTNDEQFLEKIDEIVVLTQSSYKKIKETTNTLPMPVLVNNDGVDSTVFKSVSIDEKEKLRQEKNIASDTLVFIWCSQNRKKKGLDLTLRVWKELLKKHKNIQLLVFGIRKETAINIENVTNMGLVENTELVSYYQLADFYLFPTLCQEGFGLSLVEALKCGCYCIGAENGSVPEILDYGKRGKLIDNPNIVQDWVLAIEKSIEEYITNVKVNPFVKEIPENLYDIRDWYTRYNLLTENAKEAFNIRYYI